MTHKSDHTFRAVIPVEFRILRSSPCGRDSAILFWTQACTGETAGTVRLTKQVR